MRSSVPKLSSSWRCSSVVVTVDAGSEEQIYKKVALRGAQGLIPQTLAFLRLRPSSAKGPIDAGVPKQAHVHGLLFHEEKKRQEIDAEQDRTFRNQLH